MISCRLRDPPELGAVKYSLSDFSLRGDLDIVLMQQLNDFLELGSPSFLQYWAVEEEVGHCLWVCVAQGTCV